MIMLVRLTMAISSSSFSARSETSADHPPTRSLVFEGLPAMHSKLTLALKLSAALAAVSFVGSALAQSPRPVPQAAAPTLGVAVMSALVRLDGSAVHGAGIVDSAWNGDTVTYRLRFNRSLNGCSINVTPWSPGHMANTRHDPAGEDRAIVELRYHDNAPAAGSFHLIAFCSDIPPA